MRHRLTGGFYTGLGNPDTEIMNNKWSNNKDINKFIKDIGEDVISLYFKDFDGFDFKIDDDSLTIGVEPAYQYDELKILCFTKDKEDCYYKTGIAFDSYGSGICSKIKYYKDYVKKSKFKNFIDKWHPAYLLSIQ
jgi:hypothetical protein